MLKAFDSALQDIQKQGLSHLNFTGWRNHGIRNVFYALSSPWCVSQTKIIKIKKDKPFEISIDSIEGVISGEEKKFLSGDSTESSKIIEKKIIEAKLNGYKMTEIYGKKAKDIELAFFVTLAPEYVLKEVKDAGRKYFNFRSSNFHSFALSSFSAIREIYSDKENFMFIDVHGELTDLSVIKDSVLVENFSFPEGKTFLREMYRKSFLFQEMNLVLLSRCISAKNAIRRPRKKFKGRLRTRSKTGLINFIPSSLLFRSICMFRERFS